MFLAANFPSLQPGGIFVLKGDVKLQLTNLRLVLYPAVRQSVTNSLHAVFVLSYLTALYSRKCLLLDTGE